MRRLSIAAACVAVAGSATAGGVERTNQSVGVIFKPGNYLELSFSSVNPDVSGVQVIPTGAIPAGSPSGQMAPSYANFGMALKMPINEKIDVALILDQPYGADTAYPVAPYFAAGSTATLGSAAYTGVLRYKFTDNISAFAGIRAQYLEANAFIPFVDPAFPAGAYTASGTRDFGFGYLVGAAYERPEIGLRVALTYNSSVSHSLATTESSSVGVFNSTTDVDTPQSVNLEFQTGLNPKTLLFGSVRWAEWTAFDISPVHYAALTGGGSLVSYADDVFTYNLGLGRRLNENWAIAGTVTYEKANGGFASNLSPTDGRTSVGLGVTYTQGGMELTTGVSYTFVGDAETTLGGGVAATDFSDNSAIGFGMRLGFTF